MSGDDVEPLGAWRQIQAVEHSAVNRLGRRRYPSALGNRDRQPDRERVLNPNPERAIGPQLAQRPNVDSRTAIELDRQRSRQRCRRGGRRCRRGARREDRDADRAPKSRGGTDTPSHMRRPKVMDVPDEIIDAATGATGATSFRLIIWPVISIHTRDAALQRILAAMHSTIGERCH